MKHQMNEFDQMHMPLPMPPLPEWSECETHGAHRWQSMVEEKEARLEVEEYGRVLCSYCIVEIVGIEP